MEILSDEYLTKYIRKFGDNISDNLDKIKIDLPDNNFEYYIQSAAVFSSNIEGNPIDLNTFMNSNLNKRNLKNKNYVEIQDLIKAYRFAKSNPLTEKNLLKCHNIISKQFLIKSKQGKYRKERIGVFDTGGLVYMAIEPEFVKSETAKIFKDIIFLGKLNLSVTEAFYYASMIHLVFVHIHPFSDGNGRAARLLEKWILSTHVGEIAWKIRSEYYYFGNRNKYYEYINLGPDYYELNYKKCFKFLEMLPKSIS